jgi:hypothetical protein
LDELPQPQPGEVDAVYLDMKQTYDDLDFFPQQRQPLCPKKSLGGERSFAEDRQLAYHSF